MLPFSTFSTLLLFQQCVQDMQHQNGLALKKTVCTLQLQRSWHTLGTTIRQQVHCLIVPEAPWITLRLGELVPEPQTYREWTKEAVSRVYVFMGIKCLRFKNFMI